MSTSSCNYLILGANIGYDAVEGRSDQHDEITQIGEITYLPDFIYGRYFYVGIVLGVSDYSDHSFGALNIDKLDLLFNLDALKQRVKDWVWKEHEITIDPELLLITHIS